jgi:hypothetical protein
MHVSAASGLVRVENTLYVVADDELHLGVFSAQGMEPGEVVRILDGELPIEHKDRKRVKPDFEALVVLPPFGPHYGGALLALGSGSKPQRHRCVVLPLDTHRHLTRARTIVDIEAIYATIAEEIGELNIEGATVCGNRMLLFQRGNKGAGINAVITFDLHEFCSQLLAPVTSPTRVLDVSRYDLGSVRGVPFGFSDATALSDGTVIFAAIAEDTMDSYADGRCAGAAIGSIDPSGHLTKFTPVAGPAKVEGIHAEECGDTVELLLVTDADDANIPATLYAATLRR